MTWLENHRKSEELASRAEMLERQGDFDVARPLYEQAAIAENEALEELDASKTRTLGISAVSSVALYYKAGNLEAAEAASYRFLSTGSLPEFAVEQLRGLLQSVWSERVRVRAGVGFVPGQVTISVIGGEIIEGGAPLDLIVEKAQTIQSFFYRTTELLKGLPYRRRGAPNAEIQESCRPWLFQTTPGSYRFAVAVQEPAQQKLFGANEPRPPEIMDKVLKVLRATVESPSDELVQIVPEDQYRSTFLKLARNLAPAGKRFRQIEVKSTTDSRTITLVQETRLLVNGAIKASKPSLEPGEEEIGLEGILRAVHLDKDWIEVKVNETSHRVERLGDTVDDVIGPMVNHPVIVQVVKTSAGKFRFRDIELTE